MATTSCAATPATERAADRLSRAAGALGGSTILRIAAEVRALAAAGHQVSNLTVGDFSPVEFRIPKALEDGIVDALRAGESNYPPSSGIEALRVAIQAFAERSFGVRYATESILVT